jgi:trimethylamine---corrinoid protein Co-methyltransferase
MGGGRRQDCDPRANRIWKTLLERYEPPTLDAAASEAIDAFVDRRKAEIALRGS